MKNIKREICKIVVFIILTSSHVFALNSNEQCITFKNELKKGMSGENVTKLQKFLISEKFFDSNIFGYYGNATLQAVKKYQSKNNLKVTGIFDNATIKFVNSKCTNLPSSITNPSTSTATTSQIISTVGYSPFRLEISSDKAKVNPDEQIIFNVKLINTSNATITNYRLGQVGCNGTDLDLNPNILFDGKYNFWPVAEFGIFNPCSNRGSFSNYVQNIPPYKTFEKKIVYKNFSKSTTIRLINYGEVTEGEHIASATIDIYDQDNKLTKLKSNDFKFYTHIDASPEFPKVSLNIKANKEKVHSGENIKFETSIKNIGDQDFKIDYTGQGNISETGFIVIDGKSFNTDFFKDESKVFVTYYNEEDFFRNYTGTFKKNEEKKYSFGISFASNSLKLDSEFGNKMKGVHTVQFIQIYNDNFGKSKRYESNIARFEIVAN